MQNIVIRRKFIIIIILIIILTASLSSDCSGNSSEQNNSTNEQTIILEKTTIVSNRDRFNNMTTEYTTNLLNMNYDLPIWKIGDSWIYTFSVSVQYEDSDVEISIVISTVNLNFQVISKTDTSYYLDINGDIAGDFTLKLEGYPNIKGSLKETMITGTSSIEQTTLGINEITIKIEGRLSLLGLVPIPLDIDLMVTFNPSYHTVAFPLIVGNEWEVNISTITIIGSIKLPGITQFFPGVPEEIPIDRSGLPVGGIKAICSEEEPIEVIAGQYTAYNITFNYNSVVFFAPAAGNFISIIPALNRLNENEFEFNLELISTTYNNPQAPITPEAPIGLQRGNPNAPYTYSSSTTDPQGDQIFYLFDWGDGSNSGWLGPYSSGETCEAKHQWSKKGNYNIRVQAKDVNGAESHWSNPLPIKMPYSYNQPILRFLESVFHRFYSCIIQR